MKIKLGSKEIALSRVAKVSRTGLNVARIHFHTGEALLVACSVENPHPSLISYRGTFEELKAFIDRHRGWEVGNVKKVEE